MIAMPPWPTGQRGRAWAIALGIVAAAVLAYLPSLRGGFVFDDHVLVEGGPLLRGPLWRIWFSTDPVDWWPLTNTALWLEWRVFGDWTPGHRLVSLGLHAGVALLLWRVLERLEVPAAWLGALLFAVHPVAVESVAWVSELKNTLSGILFAGACLAWLRFRDSSRTREAALAAALSLGAMLAKSSAVVLPPVLLLLCALQRRRPSRREWTWLGGLFALALVLGAVTVWFQWTRSMGGAGLDRSLAERVTGAGWAWAAYLWTAFQPFAAAVLYADWPVRMGSPLALVPLAGILLLLGALWALRGRGTWGALIALAYHGIVVLPVLGLVEMSFLYFSPIGNHLQYLALMGPAALVAAGLGRLAAGPRRALALGAAALLVLALGVTTARRSSAYVDDVSLWTRAVAEAPESLTAARLLAGALVEADRRAEAMSSLRAAAARIRAPAPNLRIRALLLAQEDRPAEAIRAETEATALREDLGFRYELAVILSRGGHPDAAVPLLEDLVRRQPRSADNRYQLASALVRTGRTDRAVTELEAGCRAAPRRSDCCTALAIVLERSGRGAEIRGVLAAAMGVPPSDAAVEEVLRLASPGGSR